MSRYRLHGAALAVEIDSVGAELSSVRDVVGNEYLWQALPVWPRRAPVLFPSIGRMPRDEIVHNGVRYPMPQHGFARDLEFDCIEHSSAGLRLVASSDAATMALFPFPFELEIGFQLDGPAVTVSHTVRNRGQEPMPASLGAHPAFVWPLPGRPSGSTHELLFTRDEPDPIRRVDEVLLRPEAVPTPVQHSRLPLSGGLFDDGALVFDRLQSRSVRYACAGGANVDIGFEKGFDRLAVWAIPNAGFLCIEPWAGLPARADFTGEYGDKPAQFVVAPGEERAFAYSIRVSPPPAS